MDTTDPFLEFRQSLGGSDLPERLRLGLIGEGAEIGTPYGTRPLVYADYTASGRALWQVENFVLTEILPHYANSHTEASHCGARMTRMRNAARAEIARLTGAGRDHAVIFTGAGATAGINRLVALWQAGPGTRVVIGPYEHHSNILPWRESGAEVVELPESASGGPCPEALARALVKGAGVGQVICAFSAASNITGDLADVAGLTSQARAAGARILWDYAGGAPYLDIDMAATGADAVVLSPHKFTGGPGASGLLILRRCSVSTSRPSWPGGGTVRFVNPEGHDYSPDLQTREEAGTPNVIGDIRAALALIVKDGMRASGALDRLPDLAGRGWEALSTHPAIELLGQPGRARLPIFAFRLRDGRGGHIHQQLVTRMLSDHYGIQTRGGCACAGPYVHRLLGIGADQSERLRRAILSGNEMEKPGFTRFNLSPLMTGDKVGAILSNILHLASRAPDLARDYRCDPARAIFHHIGAADADASDPVSSCPATSGAAA